MEFLAIGILAALLQVVGYLIYGFKVLRRDILPNPASWIMFAYGTTFLAILEWDRDASFALLILPIMCALSSIAVALYCLRKVRRAWWPEHWLEKFSFFFDVLLTVAYLYTWILLLQNAISPEEKSAIEIFVLMCWNVSIFTSFLPLLRQVHHHPSTEHVLPWVIWTCAYGLLTYLTLAEQQNLDELILYPLLAALVHAFVAVRVGYFHWRRAQFRA